MDSNFAKLLNSHRKVIVDLKKNRANGFAPYLSGASSCNAALRHSTLKSSLLKLGKRKKPDAWQNRCLPRCYTNFMRSGVPKRVMFYQNGDWVDHVSDVITVVRKEFELKKATVEVKVDDHHLILDFIRMVQFNFRTVLEQPMAWIDEDGHCFFPEVHSDNHQGVTSLSAQDVKQEIKLQIEIEVNGFNDAKSVKDSGGESPLVKRIKVKEVGVDEDNYDNESDIRVNEDVKIDQNLVKITDIDDAEKDMNLGDETVRIMFLSGMNMGDGVNLVGIGSKSDSVWKGRFELFLKQVEITMNTRGNANVRYGWLASSKEASAGIMAYGLGHFGLQQIRSTYGIGVHLAAANCADTSVNYCDVDENGVRYMVLCRIIMGNMEMVHAGSKQFHPSSENFDNGVDDLLNPRQYVVWSMNINSHIYPEYVVSFKVPTDNEGSMLKSDGNHETLRAIKPDPEGPFNLINVEKIGINHVPGSLFGTTNAGAAMHMANGQTHHSNVTYTGSKERTISVDSATMITPTSPSMPFPMLLAALSKQVPYSDMKVVLGHYGQFRNKIINRETFVKNMRQIVGDTLLKTTITGLYNKVTSENGTSDMAAQNQ